MRNIAFIVAAVLLVSGPAGAAAPIDLGTLSATQRATSLPPETTVVFRGKTTTLRALRNAHDEIVAHFAAVGPLSVHMPPWQRVTAVRGMGERANPILTGTVGTGAATAPTATPTAKPAPSSATGAVVMFPNTAPAPQPIDYQAACGPFTLCVYVPPVQPDELYTFGDGKLYVLDPIMSPQVCQQDGGGMLQPFNSCEFTYMTRATASVFPGNPPDLRSATLCLSDAFTTTVDPKGAAEIAGNASALAQAIGTNAIVCAIDLGVPS